MVRIHLCVLLTASAWVGFIPNAGQVAHAVRPGSGLFGDVGRAMMRADEVQGFPRPRNFFENYVFRAKPLVLRGAIKSMPGYQLWQNDSYFLSLETSDDTVTVETIKKENRSQNVVELDFKEFVRKYKKEDIYMVQRVPDYLGKDVIIPAMLQCPLMYEEGLVEAIIWFSSGGTKSVVHTDAVDNINCVFDGRKEFVLIDPLLHAEKVYLDHPEGAYADIDVDNVDYTKYAGLLTAEYYQVSLTAGDCFYIPYKWIHQVRSYGPRSLAINIWWDTYKNRKIDFSSCNEDPDYSLTLDKVNFIGFAGVMKSTEAVRDQYLDFTRHRKLSLTAFMDMMVGNRDMKQLGAGMGYTFPLKKIFKTLDSDSDGFLTFKEVQVASKRDWVVVQKSTTQFEAILDALDHRWQAEQELREYESQEREANEEL